MRRQVGIALGCVLMVGACSQEPGARPLPGRWYSQAQVEQGREVFVANCAVCHRADASGTTDWKRRDAAGNLPPPPLNGSAHAWHHDTDTLLRTIAGGGQQFGGTMPGFGERLSEAQMRSAIAYVQSLWPEEIYRRWTERETR